MSSAGVRGNLANVLEPDALRLLARSYLESVIDRQAGDLRRTIAVMRSAIDIALADPTAQLVTRGHVQESNRENPSRTGQRIVMRGCGPVLSALEPWERMLVTKAKIPELAELFAASRATIYRVIQRADSPSRHVAERESPVDSSTARTSRREGSSSSR